MSGQADPRLVSALQEQLTHRRRLLDAGATHVGWKLGMGDRESIGGEIAVGHLTSATCLEPGSAYRIGREDAALHADAEVAVELGSDVDPDGDAASVREAVAAYAGAVEIVDLTRLPGEPESVVVMNVFHRGVAFGPWRNARPGGAVVARLVVDGAERAAGRAPDDLGPRLLAAARLLAAVSERLGAGDRVITGSVAQVSLEPGNDVTADFGALGAARLTVIP